MATTEYGASSVDDEDGTVAVNRRIPKPSYDLVYDRKRGSGTVRVAEEVVREWTKAVDQVRGTVREKEEWWSW